MFDSSRINGGEPITFPLGVGEVIEGWDEGMIGLCTGDEATLVIPPEMGYADEVDRLFGRIPSYLATHRLSVYLQADCCPSMLVTVRTCRGSAMKSHLAQRYTLPLRYLW